MFRCLNNRVLIKPEEKEEQVVSGIIIPTLDKEKPVVGEVIVGNDTVAKGMRVLFSKYGYDEVTIDKEVHYVVSTPLLLGIFE